MHILLYKLAASFRSYKTSIIILDFSTKILFFYQYRIALIFYRTMLYKVHVLQNCLRYVSGNTDSTVAILVEMSEEKREYMEARVCQT